MAKKIPKAEASYASDGWKDSRRHLPDNERRVTLYVDDGTSYQVEGFFCYDDEGDFYDWDGEFLECVTHWREIHPAPNS